ncbi:hypothetical protein CPB84DRAFT_1770390 [Gymnopilus junonius]|uniref:Uncharacterized protein n=1 Tax=Gymnopilus junonius TaxID=109634 RepID=A0A9P5NTQ5_GYMJU|nr:hypothetical protein CPB84DRAFT_1770390 [Gymnopilus junonius]
MHQSLKLLSIHVAGPTHKGQYISIASKRRPKPHSSHETQHLSVARCKEADHMSCKKKDRINLKSAHNVPTRTDSFYQD